MAEKCYYVLGKILSAHENELISLYRRTFRSVAIMENIQMSLAWQCYRWMLLVRDKLFRHGCIVRGARRATKLFYMHSFSFW